VRRLWTGQQYLDEVLAAALKQLLSAIFTLGLFHSAHCETIILQDLSRNTYIAGLFSLGLSVGPLSYDLFLAGPLLGRTSSRQDFFQAGDLSEGPLPRRTYLAQVYPLLGLSFAGTILCWAYPLLDLSCRIFLAAASRQPDHGAGPTRGK
jgi:hypothetical protein